MLIDLRYNTVKRAAFFYLSLPTVIFCIGFLRWWAAVPAVVIMAAAWRFACRPTAHSFNERCVPIHWWELLGIAAVMLLWGYLGGLNGLFYQSNDWPYRNAIFRDLIESSWPVVYPESATALVYYIGFWLPPAAAAKLAGLLSGSQDTAWLVGQMALWIWAAVGTTFTALLLIVFAEAETLQKRVITVALFIGFSGLDIVGAWFSENLPTVFAADTLHLEWWSASGYQFSSLTTCLYWVFNQAVIPWLVVICFLMENDARNYLFLGIACLTTGPFAFVGLTVCMVVRWGSILYRDIQRGYDYATTGGALSLPNALMLVSIFPIFGLFYITNNAFAVRGTADTAAAAAVSTRDASTMDELLLLAIVAAVMAAAAGILLVVRAVGRRTQRRGAVFHAAETRSARRGLSWQTVLAAAAAAALAANAVWCALAPAGTSAGKPVLQILYEYFNPRFLVFYLLEAGVYIGFLWRSYRRDAVFHAVAVSLLFIPFFHIGLAQDFAMRASIPGIFILMAYSARYVSKGLDNYAGARPEKQRKFAALLAVLFLGGVTPAVEVYRGIYHAVTEGTVLLAQDTIGSMRVLGETENFSSTNYMEKAFFYYLARPANAVMVGYSEGVYDEETMVSDSRTWHFRWCQKTAELVLSSDYDELQSVDLQFVVGLMEGTAEPIQVTIQVDGQTCVYRVEGGAQIVRIPLRLTRGAHTITVTTDRERRVVQGDDRRLYFSLSELCLLDEKGAVIWGSADSAALTLSEAQRVS